MSLVWHRDPLALLLREPTFEASLMKDLDNSVRQMNRFMREMDHSIGDAYRLANNLVPVDMRSRQAEAWHVANPVVTDNQGNRKYQLCFDVRQYKPEEISLKTKDGHLEIHAKHEESSDNSKVCTLLCVYRGIAFCT
jgi:HSP20 family molecular chaperone IbpA